MRGHHLDVFSLLLIASSDTTAVALTSIFFELACHPEVVERLRKEVDEYYGQHDKPDPSSLGRLPYLEACVDETLRLHPPIPSGLQRVTPPEGVQIDDVFIPGNTIVQIPTYTAFRGKVSTRGRPQAKKRNQLLTDCVP